jgi:putative endonuclease
VSFLRRQEPSGDTAMDRRQPCVYMLASQRNGTIYIGVTSELLKRVWQHKNDVVKGFTSQYRVHTLVWYELHSTMESAILREKVLKKWKRAWKMRLIEDGNSAWSDLYPALL